MSKLIQICFSCVLATTTVLFVSCGGGIGSSGDIYDPGYGPFDKKGNYIEADADKKAKQRRRPGFSGGSKTVAKKTTPVKEEPIETIVSKPTPPKVTVVKKATTTYTKPKTTTAPAKKTYVAPKPKPKPKVVSKPKPKPKVVPKPKPKVVVKPKPKTIYHKVSKGDTLYSISRKYGTSVSAIQKANGVNGTLIKVGSSLKIAK